MTARKTKPRREAAKAVQQRPPKRIAFPTDAESIALRREGAAREAARVTRGETAQPDRFFGDFEVASAQWEAPYQVEIRHLTGLLNSCNCQDYRMNRLGTCKHIERVLQYIAHRRKRAFKAANASGVESYEVFFDTRETPPTLRLLRPGTRIAALDKRLEGLFDEAGNALGTGLEIWSELEARLARCPARLKAAIRLSRQADYWLDRERRPIALRQLKARFDAEVAAGRHTDNPVDLPLYPYQKQGMRHLAFKGRALLADDMGLGKTVQAIAAAELLRKLGQVRRVLVISPASLKTEWEEQIAQFTGIRAVPVFGSRATRLSAYAQDTSYTLCNYEQMRNDVDDVNRLLVPDLIVLDEAQRIKNWPTKTAKSIKRLQSPFAFVLTGTPLENRIEELYSLVEFVDPHVFGSLFRFQRDYMRLTADNDIVPRNLDQLHRVVSGVMLRRRKHDVEDTLPPRTDRHFYVTMTKEQFTRYAEFESEAAKLAAIAKRRPLTKQEMEKLQLLLGCMRMTCDTPYILDPDCRDCPKLEELENILDELLTDDEAKIIVFSEWVRMLDLVKELLVAKGIGYAEHTGRIPQQKRRAEIRRFKQDRDCRLFLSSESGGTGLNLQVANVVINLDLPWNPAKLEQRIARAWRKHQPRSVQVLNLVTENSIEHGMLGKLAYKSALADSVLDGIAFEPPAQTASGRRAFAERVGALLSGETTPAPRRGPQKPEPAGQPNLEQVLTGPQARGIRGVEQVPGTGACIISTRPDADLDALTADIEAAVDSDRTVVLTPDMRALLLRLQEMGVLTLSDNLAIRHAEEDYVPLAAESKPRTPSLDYEAARTRWQAAASERKAVKALSDIGLHAQAGPHLHAVLEAGHQAIAALYGVEPADLPTAAGPSHRPLLTAIEQHNSNPLDDPTTIAEALAMTGAIATAIQAT